MQGRRRHRGGLFPSGLLVKLERQIEVSQAKKSKENSVKAVYEDNLKYFGGSLGKVQE